MNRLEIMKFYSKLDEPFRDQEIFTTVQIFSFKVKKCFRLWIRIFLQQKYFIYISVFKLHIYFTSDDKTTASE